MIDIAWGPQYAVGNEMIDHQHQVFVDLIRSSSDAIDRRRSRIRQEIFGGVGVICEIPLFRRRIDDD